MYEDKVYEYWLKSKSFKELKQLDVPHSVEHSAQGFYTAGWKDAIKYLNKIREEK